MSVLRLKHYPFRAERSCVEWVRGFVHLRQLTGSDQMSSTETNMTRFLSVVTVNDNVAAPTQTF